MNAVQMERVSISETPVGVLYVQIWDGRGGVFIVKLYPDGCVRVLDVTKSTVGRSIGERAKPGDAFRDSPAARDALAAAVSP